MITLPKSVRRERLLENASVENIEISDEDMKIMDALDEHLVTDWYVFRFGPQAYANHYQGSDRRAIKVELIV